MKITVLDLRWLLSKLKGRKGSEVVHVGIRGTEDHKVCMEFVTEDDKSFTIHAWTFGLDPEIVQKGK